MKNMMIIIANPARSETGGNYKNYNIILLKYIEKKREK